MPLEIRLADTKEAGSVTALVRAAYAHYVARIGREPAPMTDDYPTLIADRRVWVAVGGLAIQGVLVLLPEPDALLLDNVAVDPAVKGTGIGRQLLSYAEDRARAAGYSMIRLYTNAAMNENISLYSRNGYVETHRRQEHGLHRVYMTKALP